VVYTGRQEMNTTLVSYTIPESAKDRLVLIILDPTCPRTVLLPRDGIRTIGRGAAVDIPVNDSESSRVHVRLQIVPDSTRGAEPSITLTDNHSRNGTFVGGKRLAAGTSVALAMGETFQVGRTLMTIQREESVPRPHRLFSHAYLVARLDEECARARERADHRETLFVRFSLQDLGTEDTFIAASHAVLRPFDVLARRGPREFEALVCETSSEDGQRLVRGVLEAAKAAGIEVASAVAVFPRDGRSTFALLDAAEAGLRVEASSRTKIKVSCSGEAAMDDLLGRMQGAAMNASTVLFLGETGTGKSYLAERLHALSARARGPFVVCNCGAISRGLIESELFGHARGAFTGAIAARTGLIEAADRGTLFLDEIAELPPEQQIKLLTVLDNKIVRRVGETKGRKVDFRLVASTNQDLRVLVRQGHFRPELFYRLNVIRLCIPPLRERPTAIEELVQRFLADMNAAMGRSLVLAPETLPYLRAYPWPGNIRELRHAIERAAAASAGDLLLPEDFELEDALTIEAGAPASGEMVVPKPAGGKWQATEITREQLLGALLENGGNRTRTGKALGRSREWVRQRCIELGIPLGR
jgi:two-component system, NtrC family, response regulator AtoC